MKLRTLLLTIVCMLSFWTCGRDTPATKEDTAGTDQKTEAIDDKMILLIEKRSFRNRDLKAFIQNQYSDTSDICQNGKLLSRIFDFFQEHALVLCQVEHDEVDLNEIEISDFLNTLQIQEDLPQDRFRDSVKIQKYLYFQIYHDIAVQEQEIRDYYNSHKDEFQRQDEIELYQIMVKDRDKATRIAGMLKNYPKQFEQIARRESESMEAKNNGLMGTFERGLLPTEMEDVVFSLRLNEISPIVESPYGFHIFKVTRKRNQRLLFYADVKDEIQKNLLAEKMRNAYQDFLGRLRDKYKIRTFHHNLFFSYQPHEGEQNNDGS